MDFAVKEQLARLNGLYKEQGDIYHSYAADIGISETSLWILYSMVIFNKAVTQQELCSEWHYPKQTVNSAVNGLIKSGFVILEPACSEGCRKKFLKLTEKGEEFCRFKILPLIHAEEQSLLQMGEEKRELLLILMKQQNDKLKQLLEKAKAEIFFGG